MTHPWGLIILPQGVVEPSHSAAVIKQRNTVGHGISGFCSIPLYADVLKCVFLNTIPIQGPDLIPQLLPRKSRNSVTPGGTYVVPTYARYELHRRVSESEPALTLGSDSPLRNELRRVSSAHSYGCRAIGGGSLGIPDMMPVGFDTCALFFK